MAKQEQREDVAKYWQLWADELAGAELYRALAQHADDKRKPVLLKLAEAEERHAAHWARLIEETGGPSTLEAPRTPTRVRFLSMLARRFGTDAVLPLVLRLEAQDADKYDAIDEAPASMSAQERSHGRVVSFLTGGSAGSRIARAEGRHRVGAGGALRAAIFGFNDGLVSNLSLVMGIAGGTANPRLVLLAGVAGLVAGAFSMAAGEWVSVRAQRELYEREIETERAELEHFPEEEAEELELIFQAKGISAEEARALVARIMRRPDTALDTLVREELGLDPGELASPWIAAGSSFVTFALGAVIPVIPYLVTEGSAAFAWAATMSATILVGVGAATSLFTGRPVLRSGLRMLAVGTIAASVTYGVGSLVGANV